MLQQAAKAMQYIISKQIELSGSTSAKDIGLMWDGDVAAVDERDQRLAVLEENMLASTTGNDELMSLTQDALNMLQGQISMMRESQQLIMEKLGMETSTNAVEQPEMQTGYSTEVDNEPSVMSVSA